MDFDTFFSRIKEKLIELIKRELTVLNSARVQMTTWIRFVKDEGPGIAQRPLHRVELALNSRMTSVHRGSDLEQISGWNDCSHENSDRKPSATK